jgi:transcriptional regulator with PAS, ATPase and Fis domain
VLAGVEISRHHAEFRVDGPLVVVVDLDSRNGLYINGKRCPKAPLHVGDVLRCGEWLGVVTADTDAIGFREIAPGWHGGATLFAAAEPALRMAVDLPVIVQGETGTGKEGMARAIHQFSRRDDRAPFVAFNCAAVPVNLAESELFGYKKGAFFGAEKSSEGLFRTAQGGTIFLDEILELPPEVQPKLLRVLEQREVLPLGDTKPVPIDVRVVVATQEPLEDAASEGRFRQDLFARLDGLTIVLPPLRERREDIAPLLLHFLREHTGGSPPRLDAKLVESLCGYDWPLNVRELLLVARRLLALHGQELTLRRSHLPKRILERTQGTSETPTADRLKRNWRPAADDTEFDKLVDALRYHKGNVVKAAAAIGLERGRAYRLLSAHPDFSLKDLRE